MVNQITAFTIFTFLLLTGSTALITSDPVNQPGSDTGSDAVFPVLPTDNPVSQPDKTAANERLPEVKSTETFNVRQIKPANPVQRQFFDRSTRIPLRFVNRHPCRKFKKMFMVPNKRSYGNDMILSDKTVKTVSLDVETIGDRVPVKWLEFKHKYGHRHHHYHHDKDGKFEMKDHKEKKREHKGGFMRRVRKFLKHTFD
ncbi:hypothetical protein HanXRQr2_Chr17g0780941 [Helianthus annuus]|uniref:Uncharacterized protein n=1 Tax=Helianthus annuus TaxID=4232 RepID=A0A9K3DGA8_HELAN|nr:hypothetical protein HanXRQr2_Chr17g0780941 [Helianthus annuus]KAJ0431404.1 hypothetical protein HanIR_Chr17g0848001 [Helianthus annuus]KAJ0811299.1 hypothetical protein HanPSC8_Chr17g0749181 [Helianthus annuus]